MGSPTGVVISIGNSITGGGGHSIVEAVLVSSGAGELPAFQFPCAARKFEK